MRAKLVIMSLLLLLAAPACQRTPGGFESNGGVVSVARSEDIRLPAAGVSRLLLTSAAGEIHIGPAVGDEIVIRAAKSVQGADKAENEALLNEMSITAVVAEGCLALGARAAANPDKDYWEWLREQGKETAAAAVDYTVLVPRGIVAFEIDNRAGRVMVEDVTGSFLIRAGTTDLTFTNVALTGKSLLMVQTGNIVLDINPAGAADIVVNSGAGDVKVILPETVRLNLKASVAAGTVAGDIREEVTGAGTVEETAENVDTRLLISVTTGDVCITRKKE